MAGKALEIERGCQYQDRLKILIFSLFFSFSPFNNNTLLVSYSFCTKTQSVLFKKIHHQVVFFISSLFCDIVSYRRTRKKMSVIENLLNQLI